MKAVIATGLYPPEIGGPATYAKLIARGLPERGVGTAVVSFGDVRRFPKGMSHLLYAHRLFRALGEADIIYALDPVSVGVPACLAAWLRGKPLMVRVAGDYAWEQGVQRFGVEQPLDAFVRTPQSHPLVRFLQYLERTVTARARCVIVPSEYLKRIVSRWGVEEKRIRVIHSVVEEPRARGRKATLRGILQFRGHLVISVGRLVPWKGFRGLIDAAGKLSREFPDLKLFIAGEGPE